MFLFTNQKARHYNGKDCTIESRLDQDELRTTKFQIVVGERICKPVVYNSGIEPLKEFSEFAVDFHIDFVPAKDDADVNMDDHREIMSNILFKNLH